MQLAKETPILKRQYEQQVALATELDFFNQVWVQDILHQNWSYLIDNESNILLRLPYTKKWGFKAYLQPLFIRSLTLFAGANAAAVLQILHSKLFLHVNLNEPFKTAASFGIFQKLTWNKGIHEIRGAYSDNIKRSLKKSTSLTIKEIIYPDFHSFFVTQKGENLGKLTSKAWQRLAKLVEAAQTKDAVFCVGAYSQDQLLAAALFFKWKDQLYFMKGTLNEAGKKTGALVFLIDTVLEKYADECQVLDFIGSNQESIASFYRKFGAKDYHYSTIKGRIPLV